MSEDFVRMPAPVRSRDARRQSWRPPVGEQHVLLAMWEAVGLGLAAIRAYKMRAGLTILGVVMGIMTVTGMSAIVAGLNRSMASQIEGLGSSVIFIRFGQPGENLSPEEFRRRRLLNWNEVKTIEQRCRLVTAVAPLEFIQANTVKYGGERLQEHHTFGVTADYESVHDTYVARGRFISDADVSRGAPVAVVGTEVVEALFPAVEPLGKRIEIDGRGFTIIGVKEHQGRFIGFSQDNVIMVPLGTFQRHSPLAHRLFVDMRPVSAAFMDDAIEEVREVLRRKRRLRFWETDNFGIFTQDSLTDL
ncbi:MAG: ABC transporter permease, partial [Vicinamibacteria bacterium]|nr:ABC transporter permease [Vicinamibacteria bacterium]